ncbi:flagellar transcriptional regulator FlhD [Bordetella flabilis]|uniref:Flagellar transcriptional regulator FlhD n=1 Tax=Bordetella flabilis TaxID=463014 RepID=A0A193GL82_9BORD|nr:flagellar transcriptional regulator FlhD [Bordetella flabilis]ANN80852.1 hypothetical protein BAU07_26380 [Bordetella flabilis]
MQSPGELSIDTLSAIREVNLSYLLVAKHLLRDNRASAMFRLGLDEETAQILLALTPAQTVQIASAGSLLCGFRLNEANLRALGLDESRPAARVAGHYLHHVTILLAKQALAGETR